MGRKKEMLDVTHPELCEEWDYEKNAELPKKLPSQYTHGSNVIVWWKCPNCKSSYDMKIASRTYKNFNCPYCAGRRVNHTNSLASLHPYLTEEWHPTLNGDLTPYQISANSHTRVWWIGKDCGHVWDTVPSVRTAIGCGCPFCSNPPKRIEVGFNDMWTTNPQLASLLADPEDGYKYSSQSHGKVEWICGSCGKNIGKKSIYNVARKGIVPCPKCSDGFSFGEKIVYALLEANNKEFEVQKTLKCSNYRYDFYLPSDNCIIEVHGIQHYEESGFHEMDNSTLQKEQEKDREKEVAAKSAGIKTYLVIDARKSDINYILNSLLEQAVDKILKLDIEEDKIVSLMEKSLLIRAAEEFNKGSSTKDIENLLRLSRSTVIRYLKRATQFNLCNYSAKEQIKKGSALSAPKRKKIVYMLDKNLNILKEFPSLTEATESVNGKTSSAISSACSGRRQTAYGFKWMYKEDYDKMIANQQKEMS